MGVATLAAELGVDEVTAGEYLRGWDEQAPTGAAWRASLPRLYAAEQGVRTARRWIDYLDDDDADAAANTRPMNYPVQGGAADVMHRAMRLLFERYRDWPGNVLPVLTVHDEVRRRGGRRRCRSGRLPAGRCHGRGFPRRAAERADAVPGHSRHRVNLGGGKGRRREAGKGAAAGPRQSGLHRSGSRARALSPLKAS